MAVPPTASRAVHESTHAEVGLRPAHPVPRGRQAGVAVEVAPVRQQPPRVVVQPVLPRAGDDDGVVADVAVALPRLGRGQHDASGRRAVVDEADVAEEAESRERLRASEKRVVDEQVLGRRRVVRPPPAAAAIGRGDRKPGARPSACCCLQQQQVQHLQSAPSVHQDVIIYYYRRLDAGPQHPPQPS